MFELSARHLFAPPLALVFAAPLVAQSQPPFLEAESLNPVAATLPAIDIATQGEQIAVAWFDWVFAGLPTSDRVITLVSRDANGAIVAETVSELHAVPLALGGGDFLGLAGPTLVDVTTDAVVSTSTPWNRLTLFGTPSFFAASSSVIRHERQSNGTWLAVDIGGTNNASPLDLVATDDLVVWTTEAGGAPLLRTVSAIELASPGVWTTKTIKTFLPAQSLVPRVDTNGEVVVIGLDASGASTPLTGRVELHRRNSSGNWQLEQTLMASDAVAGDRFGSDVSIDGDRLAITAVQPGTGTFVAYVFERAPGTTGPWSEVAKLVPPAPFAPPTLPQSTGANYRKQSIVALEGGRVVVSQAKSDAHAPGAGSADVYMRSPTGTWEHSVRLAPRSGATQAFTSMDADGDRVVAAAFGFTPDRGTYDVYDFGSLLAVGDGPSLTTAAPQTLAIDEGIENGGDAYAMLGSLTGTTPGVLVPTTPYTLPLVLDPYFAYTLQSVGGGGLLSAPFGVLDNRGRATCDFTIPTGLPASLVGVSIFHAAVIFDLQAPGVPATHVTNPVTSVLLP